PGVAQAVGPQLGPGAPAIDEWVILGDAVIPARVGAIDVDPQDGPQQVVEGLAGQVGVGGAGAGPRGNGEGAVVAEGEGAAVVAIRGPLDDHDSRFRVDAVGLPAVHRVTHDLGLLVGPALVGAIQADVDVAVTPVVGVEGQADGEAVDVEQGLGLGHVLV